MEKQNELAEMKILWKNGLTTDSIEQYPEFGISLSLKKLKESENTNMTYLNYTLKLQPNALSFNLLPIYSTQQSLYTDSNLD